MLTILVCYMGGFYTVLICLGADTANMRLNCVACYTISTLLNLEEMNKNEYTGRYDNIHSLYKTPNLLNEENLFI